jgi:hypothetical protein
VASRTVLATTVTRVSITADAPAEAPPQPPHAASASAAWWWLVAASVLMLLLAAGTLAGWWLATRETRTTSYRVLGDLGGIRLDLGDADVQIDGGATAVEVRRVDRFAFGKPSEERHSVDGGRLTVVSRCPDQVLGSCRASFRLTVPDNVPVEIETAGGAVRVAGVRASVRVNTLEGPIAVTGYCGFSLRASSDTGDVGAVSECPAERLELRSRSGDVRAVVPSGRYQIDAQSDTGNRRVRGLTHVEEGAFQLQALSTSGDVTVEAAS